MSRSRGPRERTRILLTFAVMSTEVQTESIATRAWQFSARAIEPTTAIFFYGAILQEFCEKDHSLGYELLKRISAVMVKRLQAAHKQMLSVYVDSTFHEPSRFC
jgi:hypothetical protein